MRAGRLGKKCWNSKDGPGRLQRRCGRHHAMLPIVPAATGEVGDAMPAKTTSDPDRISGLSASRDAETAEKLLGIVSRRVEPRLPGRSDHA
jgi:hypothetical protein